MSHSATYPARDRLHGLDALRGGALLLGIVLHLTMSFLPGAQYTWIVADKDPSTALGLLFYGIHLFRMLTFFLLAGFFARMGLERLGVGGFIRDRCKRIVVPLLVGWPLALTAIIAVAVWAAMRANGGAVPAQSPPGPTFMPNNFPLTHLWFLWELLLAYTGALVLRGIVTKLDLQGRWCAGLDRTTRLLLAPGGVVFLAAPLALALFVQPKWFLWFGIPTPDQTLYPNLPAAAGFGLAFGFGWLLQRQPALLAKIERHCLHHLVIALVFAGISLLIAGVEPTLAPAPMDGTKLAYATTYAIAGWSTTFAAIGLALRFLSGESAFRRYVADASYWVYLIHLPLVMTAQVAFSRLDWPWQLKFPVMLVLTCSVMFASYRWCVRNTFIGAQLNGRRYPRRVPEPANAAPASGR